MADKKNPYRTISTDMRAIADLPRVNLSFPPEQYYMVIAHPREKWRAVLLLYVTSPKSSALFLVGHARYCGRIPTNQTAARVLSGYSYLVRR